MTDSKLSKEIALRIGMAARALPDTDASRLLKILDSEIGLPPTLKSLSELTVKKLRHARGGELSDIDTATLVNAISFLKGEISMEEERLPEIKAYKEGDMPGSIRVACASNKGEELDGHFGSCQRFLIYQLNKTEIRLIDIRNTSQISDEGDKNANRAVCIDDCNVLYVASIGGPAAAKVVRAGIHPMKHPAGGRIRDLLAELQQVLSGMPPPWLAKAMGYTDEERVRFQRTAKEAAS